MSRIRARAIWAGVTFSVLLIVAAVGLSIFQQASPKGAYAGAQVSGDQNGATDRLLISNGGDSAVTRIVYFKMESHATGGANTPVASSNYCGSDVSGVLHEATVKLSGTMAGTNPTLSIKWQNSKDNKSTWTDVGTWTTINATVTPASQTNTVADSGAVVLMNANTPVVTPPVVYGDCWRVLYTMAGTDSVAANFSVTGVDK